MKIAVNLPSISWLPAVLLVGLLCGPGWAQGLRSEYPSLKLDFQQRFTLWLRLVTGENRDEGLALGESVVRDSVLIRDKVFTASVLSKNYIDFGDFERAQELLEQARQVTQALTFRSMPEGGEAGHWKHWALYNFKVADCLLAKAAYQHERSRLACAQAIGHAERARSLLRFAERPAIDADDDVIAAHLYSATALRLGGRVHDAHGGVKTALQWVEKGLGKPASHAFAYRTAARILLDLGDIAQAEAMARRSVTYWDTQGVSPTYIRRLWGRVELQNVLVLAGRWTEANQEFDAADVVARGNATAMRAVSNTLARALTYAHGDRLVQLHKVLDSQSKLFQSRMGIEHPQSALREGLFGIACAERAEVEIRQAAAPALRHAVQALLAANARGDWFGDGTLDEKVAHYVLERYLEAVARGTFSTDKDHEQAFQVGELLRGSRVQAAIQDAAIRSAVGSGPLAALVRQEQDLRNESRMLQGALVDRVSEGEAPRANASVDKVRTRIAEIDAQRLDLRDEILKSFPEYDALVRARPPTPSQISSHLSSGGSFVSLLPTEKGVHVWAMDRAGMAYHFAPILASELGARVARLRKSLSFSGTGGAPPPFAADTSWELYRDLVAPVQARLEPGRHLTIAAGGVLGMVPFSALLTQPPIGPAGRSWLMTRNPINHVPSASAWLAVLRLGTTRRAQEPFRGWGDPDFSSGRVVGQPEARVARVVSIVRATATVLKYSSIPPLPETRDELTAIALALKADPQTNLLLGVQATRESVLNASRSGELQRQRVLAFATHGLMAGDLPNLSQPALAMAATGTEDEAPLSPLLTLEDVLTLKLNADWVVLSACNTAAADGRADEALSGLARGFFYAGSRSLLVTHWAVETESAKRLTTATFSHYTGNPSISKAESLRFSMLELLADPQYAHPVYWAPFALIGDGGR